MKEAMEIVPNFRFLKLGFLGMAKPQQLWVSHNSCLTDK